MIKGLRECFDEAGISVALLTVLSKAFACPPNNLLTAMLHVYGMEGNSLKLLFSSVENRK